MRSLFLVALAVAALPALAEETPGREDAAWLKARTMLGGTLSGPQQAALTTLAWHVVAAELCEDLHLDTEKVAAAVAALEHSDSNEMDEGAHEAFEDLLKVNFGVAVGILLAEHADSVETTCAEAAAHRAEPGSGHLFVAVE